MGEDLGVKKSCVKRRGWVSAYVAAGADKEPKRAFYVGATTQANWEGVVLKFYSFCLIWLDLPAWVYTYLIWAGRDQGVSNLKSFDFSSSVFLVSCLQTKTTKTVVKCIHTIQSKVIRAKKMRVFEYVPSNAKIIRDITKG